MPGALILSMTARSVLRDDRAAELVVHADGDEIDVLTDAIGTEERASRRGEAVGALRHEQVIVLDRGRPVRGEAVFEADADHATPAGVVAGGGRESAASGVDAVTIRGHRSTTLEVEQDVVGGIADLTSEQAERVDLRGVDETGEQQARVRALQVSPVTLRFNAEHPSAGLPAITDLTTGDAHGVVIAAFTADQERRHGIPAVVAPTPTTLPAET